MLFLINIWFIFKTMGWRNFNKMYFNGCSHTAGSGLQTPIYHKDKHNLDWVNEREVNYPFLVAKHFNCELIDNSQSGSGLPRLIRTTYEYINKVGIKDAKKTLFVFQINQAFSRIEVFSKEINDYLIVNLQYNKDGTFQYVNAVEKYSATDRKYNPSQFEGKIENEIKDFLEKYHNPILYEKKYLSYLNGLFSFLEINNIEYLYGLDLLNDGTFIEKKENKINLDGYDTIHEYCWGKNLKLSDEIGEFTDDAHPGYFGHKKFAEDLSLLIEQKYKPTLWVFGDSYSSESKPNIDVSSYLYENDFRMKYSKFKGYFPNSFPEIISKKLDLNLINLAVPGNSNEQIYQSYLKNIENIKPNDILFFGWTYISRYVLAGNDNKFHNVNIPYKDVTFEDNLTYNTINEVLHNRSKYSIYYTYLTNYLKSINKMFNNNIIIHNSFSDIGESLDENINDYMNLLFPRRQKYETIKEETKDDSFNGHYSEKGHQDLAEDIINYINKI